MSDRPLVTGPPYCAGFEQGRYRLPRSGRTPQPVQILMEKIARIFVLQVANTAIQCRRSSIVEIVRLNSEIEQITDHVRMC